MQVPPNGLVIYTGTVMTDDGKEMSFNPETTQVKEVIAEVDRHSRMLARKADLTSG